MALPLKLPKLPARLEGAERRNILLLIQLRWLAVGGQLTTILIARFALGVPLPLEPMLAALGILALLNLVLGEARRRGMVGNAQIFATLLVDVACLTVQLSVSGGVGNPFISLFLLQVVLAAVLLPPWAGAVLVVLTSALFAWLAVGKMPFALPEAYASHLSRPYVVASWFNYTLAATLLAMFVTRIVRNLGERNTRLAALRQRAVEEEHIVRMGLLASGAAHELGTPLSSIAVMLGDWRTEPVIAESPRLRDELDDMRSEVMRCKEILGRILLASGEVRGDAPRRTTLAAFLSGIVADWRERASIPVEWHNRIGEDVTIVGDQALAQTIANLLDNAVEAGARRIVVEASRSGEQVRLAVRDDGRGFAPAILKNLGRPYQSTKTRLGAGLGLFLATNVLRALGGGITARNLHRGGSEILLTWPGASLAIGEGE
ncbi:ATP-binding protein [Sphingomonas sp.]|uniref:ATP-binding protein n=1 Tax=Sphingomonas sp. TaxID=28214 RepID=UPI003B3AC99B